MKYREPLPPSCPPNDAEEITSSFVVFRLVQTNPPTEADFKSLQELNPDSVYKKAEKCRARGLSVYTRREDAEFQLNKFPKFRGYFICTVQLEAGAGSIQKTSGISHHTWWPTSDFNILAHCVVE